MTRDEFYRWFREEHIALHTAWTADVGQPWYNKRCWMQREAVLHRRARDLAGILGVSPPFLRW